MSWEKIQKWIIAVSFINKIYLQTYVRFHISINIHTCTFITIIDTRHDEKKFWHEYDEIPTHSSSFISSPSSMEKMGWRLWHVVISITDGSIAYDMWGVQVKLAYNRIQMSVWIYLLTDYVRAWVCCFYFCI